MKGWRHGGALALAAGLWLAPAAAASGQSLLERTPNVSGGWTGGPHSVHFNFLHRFNHTGPPQRQVTNRPTFLVAYGPRFGGLLGAQYATRSDVVANLPNEWEAFARYGVLSEAAGHGVDVAAQVSYNAAAESVDGEIGVARRAGPVRVLGAARLLSSAYGGDARVALAGGAAVRLGQWMAVAADAGRLSDAGEGERTAWGVALQFGIPLTPHSFSLQATNTNSATLQGASRGADEVRWGFEFTVPVALARYFGPRQPPAPPVAAAPVVNQDSVRRAALIDSVRTEMRREFELVRRQDSVRFALRDDSLRLAQQLAAMREAARQDSIERARRAAVLQAAADSARMAAERLRASRPPFRASMRNLAYTPTRIVVDVGTTVIWRNDDQVEHTVTATDRSWDSGVIRPGATWQHTFTSPGTYEFFCVPHPFMTGTVIVRGTQ